MAGPVGGLGGSGNPWSPPDWLTRYKLAQLDVAPTVCLAALEQATMRFEPVADRVVAPGCGFDNAVRIERTSVQVGKPFTLLSRAAVSATNAGPCGSSTSYS